MNDRRPITEDDILLTEMLLARSYGNLKRSVVRTSSDTLGVIGDSLGTAVRKHPYATAGAAVGAGILLVGLFKMMGMGGNSGDRRCDGDRDRSSRSSSGMDLVSMLMPLVMPYITAYLENFLGSRSGRRGN
ncbi:MAG: hypothetical protein GYA23_02645 [Methanomicrobiales archaeon]|nr:hypothetical protein [Methanomicrobiales archaeon]